MEIRDQLGQNEELVWLGKANSDRLLRRSDYAWVWLGILLGTIAMAAFVGAVLALIDGGAEGAVVGFLLAVIVGFIAIYLVFGRIARRFGRTHRAAYGITTSRVIAMRGDGELGGSPSVEQVTLAADTPTGLQTHYERRGTISVGDIKLENIDDAAVVYELLQSQIAQIERAQG